MICLCCLAKIQQLHPDQDREYILMQLLDIAINQKLVDSISDLA